MVFKIIIDVLESWNLLKINWYWTEIKTLQIYWCFRLRNSLQVMIYSLKHKFMWIMFKYAVTEVIRSVRRRNRPIGVKEQNEKSILFLPQQETHCLYILKTSLCMQSGKITHFIIRIIRNTCVKSGGKSLSVLRRYISLPLPFKGLKEW
jgi:hypothetical protein